MITLIYNSTASYNCSNEKLELFLSYIRPKNINRKITGIMLYHEGEIMQILEGEEEVIYNLFEKIKVDNRHTNVIKLNEFKMKQRAFDEWSMCFKRVSLNDMLTVKGYLNINEIGIPNATDKSVYLQMLINSFKDENVKN